MSLRAKCLNYQEKATPDGAAPTARSRAVSSAFA
jgi:hypothetical protein